MTDFGGSAAPGHNNAAAIAAAVEACRRAAGGCRLSFPARAGEPSAAPTVYRTSSFALASAMTLHIPAGVVLRGTETDADNLLDGSPWPVLPRLEAPAVPCMSCAYRCGGGCGPVKRAWLHAWNVTDLEITGGGTLHGGGQYWWCARQPDAALARKPDWCAAANRTLRNMCPPRMIHIVESRDVHVHGVRIEFSPFWTAHFQFCEGVLLEQISVFNPVR